MRLDISFKDQLTCTQTLSCIFYFILNIFSPCIKTFIGLLIIIAINTTNKEMTGMKQIVSKKLIDSMQMFHNLAIIRNYKFQLQFFQICIYPNHELHSNHHSRNTYDKVKDCTYTYHEYSTSANVIFITIDILMI